MYHVPRLAKERRFVAHKAVLKQNPQEQLSDQHGATLL
jgi:hypothetical protein